MRINELLTEDQIDEIDMSGIKSGLRKTAKGLGSVVGSAARGIGAVAGGAAGLWDQGRAGYNAGRAFVGAPTSGRQTSSSYYGGGTTIGKMNYGKMSGTDLNAEKAKIDAELAARTGQTPKTTSAPQQATNTTPQNVAPQQAAPAGPEKGKIYSGPDGNGYKWLGNQWLNTATNQPAPKPMQRAMTQRVQTGQAQVTTLKPRKGQTVQGSDGQAYTWQGAAWTAPNGRMATKNIGAELTNAVASGTAKTVASPKVKKPAARRPAVEESFYSGFLGKGI